MNFLSLVDQVQLLLLCSSGSTCEQPYVPVNADFSCLKEEKGVNCTLVCRLGYSLSQNAVHSYFCPNNGQWEPPRSSDRPDCSCQFYSCDTFLFTFRFSSSCLLMFFLFNIMYLSCLLYWTFTDDVIVGWHQVWQHDFF